MNEWIHWVENLAYIKINQIQIDQHYDICISIYIQEKEDNFSVIHAQPPPPKKNLRKSIRKSIRKSFLVLKTSALSFFNLNLTEFFQKIRESRNPQSSVKDLMKITDLQLLSSRISSIYAISSSFLWRLKDLSW